jgi:hypothetical protein
MSLMSLHPYLEDIESMARWAQDQGVARMTLCASF